MHAHTERTRIIELGDYFSFVRQILIHFLLGHASLRRSGH